MLEITSILPLNNSVNIPIDQKITIEFNEPIDIFSIINGISVYTTSDGVWSGPDLSILDTKYSDVLSVSDDYYNVQYTYAVSGNVIEITPSASLLPDRTYYVSVFPGNDVSRYVSTETYADAVYTRVASSTGTLAVSSPYVGADNGEYEITITDTDTFDLLFGIEYLGTFTFADGIDVDLGNITIKLTGAFDIGDIISVPVFKASGISSLYKVCFTTNKYVTAIPTSQRVDDTDFTSLSPLSITNTIPKNYSVNNMSCNPITIKFNKDIKADQDLTDKITIQRTDLLTGRIKDLKYRYKINGNILKLYLISG